MTLGRTADNAIKIKVEDGTTRAVNCACCGGCEGFENLTIYVNGTLMEKTPLSSPSGGMLWTKPDDCSILWCSQDPFTGGITWYYDFNTGFPSDVSEIIPCAPDGSSCDEIYGTCIFDFISISDGPPVGPNFPFQDGETPYGTFVQRTEPPYPQFIFTFSRNP